MIENIIIITSPFAERKGSYSLIFNNLIQITTNHVDKIHIISSNAEIADNYSDRVNLHNIPTRKISNNIGRKILRRISFEISASIKLIEIQKTSDGSILILSGELILPTLTAKLLGKKTLLVAIASAKNNYILRNRNKISSKIISNIIFINERFNQYLASYIGTESPNVASFLNLTMSEKLIPNEPLYLHNESFEIIIPYEKREKILGFVGRLSAEKGTMEFIQSMKKFCDTHNDWQVIIVGDGPLSSQINHYIDEQNLRKRITCINWVNHNNLPKLLNTLKLLVLPSYTEGLPNILLEAMSCGIPVLGSPVGGISDVIKDDYNGFILKDNSPESISSSLDYIISKANLESISVNAVKTITEKYSQKRIIEIWGDILTKIS